LDLRIQIYNFQAIFYDKIRIYALYISVPFSVFSTKTTKEIVFDQVIVSHCTFFLLICRRSLEILFGRIGSSQLFFSELLILHFRIQNGQLQTKTNEFNCSRGQKLRYWKRK
jgi:hypothetical protein